MKIRFSVLCLISACLLIFGGSGWAEVSPAGPVLKGQAPWPQDWTLWPSGDEGEARMVVAEDWHDAVKTEALEFRVALLSAEENPRVLTDPVKPYSMPRPCPQSSGSFTLQGLPSKPCAVQIRAKVDGTWTDWSLFKRLGEYYFGYDDEVVKIPGCVTETTPEIIYFGADNLAGEGRQRLDDGVLSIVKGNLAGHFEVLKEEGRVYLVPTQAGVDAWSGGEQYVLHSDNGAVLKVEVLPETAVLASETSDLGGRSVQEYLAYFKRYQKAGLSGKTLLLRPGLYDTASMPVSAPFQNHFLFGGHEQKFILGSVDAQQPAVLTGLNIVAPHDQRGSIQWNFRVENIFF